jgi:hypothetical protein
LVTQASSQPEVTDLDRAGHPEDSAGEVHATWR